MPPKKKDDDGDNKVEVDIEAIKKFGGFLIDQAGTITGQMNTLDTIEPRAGNTALFKTAGTLNNKVLGRRDQLKTTLETLRSDLELLGDNMLLVANMYEAAENDAEAEATGLLPLIAPGATPPAAPPPPPQT